MPYYNRFDICAAYYHYACISTSYDEICAIMDKLERVKYRPGLSDSRLSTLSVNAKAIYMQLIRKSNHLYWSKN